METNFALVQAASSLERFMSKQPYGGLQESITPQVSATIYYQTHVIANLIGNAAFRNRFQTVIFNQVEKDFGLYIDSKARTSPKSMHHVYEWNKAGLASSRLFKLNRLDSKDLSLSLSYDFLPSKTFAKNGKRRHVFINKASVMEAGMPLKIAPRFSERLIFDVNGKTIYMPKGESVTVSNPGGKSVKRSFESAYKMFFSSNLINLSINRSGFQYLFNNSITRAMRLPFELKTVKYSFNPSSLRYQAEFAVTSAFGGIS